jgi:polyhydroxybutyrate depolymerase
LTWNAGHCCGWAYEHHVDDIGFIAALLAHLLATSPIDPQRLYITGMSNGAMLTHRLGIALPERIAAIAPVVGAVFGDEKAPAQPVSALMINGLLDETVPFAGGPLGGRAPGASDGTPLQPVSEQGAFWARANGCTGAVQRENHGDYELWRHTCPQGVTVMQIVVNDNGHAWPGGQKGSPRGDAPSSAIDATSVIWDFLKTTGAKRKY